MKHIAIFLVCVWAYSLGAWGQNLIPHSQVGFDVEKAGIAKRSYCLPKQPKYAQGVRQTEIHLFRISRWAYLAGMAE